MTRKAWKPCRQPGCPVLIRSGGYCADHARRNETRRGTSHQRGYDKKWRRFRDQHLKERCEECDTHEARLEHPLELHHKDGLGPTGPRGYDPTNVETLCKPCHTRKTAGGAHR